MRNVPQGKYKSVPEASEFDEMTKVTIQACLDTKDLDFLEKLRERHALKNHSDTIRTMIARYKGMEDWIQARRKTEIVVNQFRDAKQVD